MNALRSAQRSYDAQTPDEESRFSEQVGEWLDRCPLNLSRTSLLRARIAELVIDEHELERSEP